MNELKTRPQRHLQICCRVREDGKPACGERGAAQLVANLKERVKAAGLKSQVKVTQSSCLGYCEQGITAALYPENRWFIEVSAQDEEKLWQTLVQDRVTTE